MVHFFTGITRCAVCNHPINAEPYLFPAFLPPGHELAKFCDSAYHRSCFDRWDQKQRFSMLFERYRQVRVDMPALASVDEAQAYLRDRMAEFDRYAMNH